jgi:hypothetical protein
MEENKVIETTTQGIAKKKGRPFGFKPKPKVATAKPVANEPTMVEAEIIVPVIKKTDKAYPFAAQRNRDAEMVTGIFHWNEVKGGLLEFMYRGYKDEPIKKYALYDGERYTIPRGVARHLNTNGWTPVYKYKEDGSGRPKVTMTSKEQRFSFQSLDFIDDTVMDNKAKQIIVVDKI